MRLYLVHDEDDNYKIVISALNADEALAKLQRFLEETKQKGEGWITHNAKWSADLCDNDKVIE